MAEIDEQRHKNVEETNDEVIRHTPKLKNQLWK